MRHKTGKDRKISKTEGRPGADLCTKNILIPQTLLGDAPELQVSSGIQRPVNPDDQPRCGSLSHARFSAQELARSVVTRTLLNERFGLLR